MVVVTGPRIDPGRSPRRPAWRCTASCPTSTCTTRPATSRSSRAGSARRWSSRQRPAVPVLPARPPLRAAGARAAPARAAPGRARDGLRDADPGRIADALVEELGDGRRTSRCRRTAPGSRLSWWPRCSEPAAPRLGLGAAASAVRRRGQGGEPALRAAGSVVLEVGARQQEVAVRSRDPGAARGARRRRPAARPRRPGRRRPRSPPPAGRRSAAGGLRGLGPGAGQPLTGDHGRVRARPSSSRVLERKPAAVAYHHGWSTGEVSASAPRPCRSAPSRSPASRSNQPTCA